MLVLAAPTSCAGHRRDAGSGRLLRLTAAGQTLHTLRQRGLRFGVENAVMSTAVSVCAQLLPFLAPVLLLLVWWRLPKGARAWFGVLAVVSGVCAGALVLVAGLVHDDPRPFVIDPSHPPLFRHSADNGFPSDHTTYAATAALVVATVRRRFGLLLLASAVLGGLARVAANVHHVQDIVAGLVIAVVAVGGGLGIQGLLDRRQRGRRNADPKTPSRVPS